jgi:hypothetical protein
LRISSREREGEIVRLGNHPVDASSRVRRRFTLTTLIRAVVVNRIQKAIDDPIKLAPGIIETVVSKIRVELLNVVIVNDGLGSVVEDILRDLKGIKETKRARNIELEALVVDGKARKLNE